MGKVVYVGLVAYADLFPAGKTGRPMSRNKNFSIGRPRLRSKRVRGEVRLNKTRSSHIL